MVVPLTMMLAVIVQLPTTSEETVPAPLAARGEPVPVSVNVGVTPPGRPLVAMVTAPVATAYDTVAVEATSEATTATCCDVGVGT